MNIVMVSSEASPYSKTGGLADVVGALPAALRAAGHRVITFTPCYRQVQEGRHRLMETGIELRVPLGETVHTGRVLKAGDVYFIANDLFFSRDELYGTGPNDYPDNALRFAFFCRAVLEAIRAMGEKTDIIHCHDWQSALVPLYLKHYYSGENALPGRPATLFTIHNLAYQGLFEREILPQVSLPERLFNLHELEFHGRVSFIKAGLVFAGLLNTVSAGYSREIQTPGMGCGLHGLLSERKKELFGILNGIDCDAWDPAKDPHIAANYSAGNLRGKAACKREIRAFFGLSGRRRLPLVGMIARLDRQKGFTLIAEAAGEMMKLPIEIVFLGRGDPAIEAMLEGLKRAYPGRVGLKIGFDEALAHRIEAASDIFLMPSYYEPCGFNQMYSLKYGTVPVVHATGGLDDTITAWNPGRKSGNGFKFSSFNARAMLSALGKAADLYLTDKKGWHTLQAKGMSEDFSWGRSARAYERLYRRALRNEGGKEPSRAH